jgi:hypothetical protein
MLSPQQLWSNFANAIKERPRELPSTVTIPRAHLDENLNGELDDALLKDKHYFQVIVNEMYLANARQWLHEIEPVVYVVGEFVHAGEPKVVPLLVGPSLVKQFGVPDEYAKGMIFRNTSVFGLYPYRGGGLTLSVVLAEAKGNSPLRPMLGFVETAAKVLGFSPALAPYASVANLVMDGFETLFQSGSVVPLVGFRDSFGPNQRIPFQPSYFALIDAPAVDPETLWVRNRQLVQGSSLDDAEPYRAADYVLYSIVAPAEHRRDDVDILPFNEQWERVKSEASSPIDDPNYKNARVQMSALYQAIITSPDLTDSQADALAEEYASRMKAIHDRAVRFSNMDQGQQVRSPEQARLDRARSGALAILNS